MVFYGGSEPGEGPEGSWLVILRHLIGQRGGGKGQLPILLLVPSGLLTGHSHLRGLRQIPEDSWDFLMGTGFSGTKILDFVDGSPENPYRFFCEQNLLSTSKDSRGDFRAILLWHAAQTKGLE